MRIIKIRKQNDLLNVLLIFKYSKRLNEIVFLNRGIYNRDNIEKREF